MAGSITKYVETMQEMLARLQIEWGGPDSLKFVIREEGDKFVLYSEDGSKKLGTFDTRGEAEDREKEINVLKHIKGSEWTGEGSELTLKDYTTDQRKEMASQGQARSDGSYPIADKADLHNAIMSWGRGGATAEDKAHIMKRARALGATDMLPEGWDEGRTGTPPAPPVPAPKPHEQEVEAWSEPLTFGVEFGEGSPIQVMKTGTFLHPKHGKFVITTADLQQFKDNFDKNVRGQQIPIDIDHEGGAVGWYKSVEVVGDKLMAVPDWNSDGEGLVRKGAYKYFSPEFLRVWPHPESGAVHKNVLIGGAITNYPFLKGMDPILMSEFREGVKKGGAMSLTEEEIAELQKKAAAGDAAVTEAEELRNKLAEAEKGVVQMTETEKLLEGERGERLKLAEQIKTLTHNELVGRMRSIVRGDGEGATRFSGDEDDKIKLAVMLAEAHGEDSEMFKGWVENEQANALALRTSGAFKEVGTSRSGSAGTGGLATQDEYKKELAAIKAADPKLNDGDAAMKLMEDKPDLYRRYDREQKAYARTHGSEEED